MLNESPVIRKEFYLVLFGILPSFFMYLVSKDALYVKMALISTSLIITQLTLQCSLRVTVAQYVQILLLSVILYKLQGNVIAYSLFSSLTCAYYLNLSRYGANLRVYASFIIVPAFYLSTEVNRLGVANNELFDTYISHIPFSILPSVVLSFFTDNLRHKANLGKHYAEYNQLTVSVFLSVLACSIFSYYFNWQHSEWILWSAISVSTGEFSSMKKKVKHRLFGALLGITIGIIISIYMPTNDAVRYLSVALIPLTIPLRNYFIAFSIRCALTVLSVGPIAQIDGIAVDKISSIYIGGLIGYFMGFLVINARLKNNNANV